MGLRGLEPPWVTPTDPKSVASASFATGPCKESNIKHVQGRAEEKWEKGLDLWQNYDIYKSIMVINIYLK